MLATSFRFASRSLLRSRAGFIPAATLRATRSFSKTQSWRASENEDSFMSNYQNTPLFQQLADKPDALQALNDFAKLLEEAGIDVTGNKQPTASQLFRLSTSSRFRESAKAVLKELQNAGIDVTSQEAMEEIMNMGKVGGGKS